MSGFNNGDVRDGFRMAPVIWVFSFLAIAGIFSLIFIFQPWAQKIDTSNAKHQVTIQQISASAYANNPGNQQADIDQMENAISDIDPANLPATNAADARTACKYFARIIPAALPPGDKPWTDQNCLGSQLAPGSQYNQ